MKIKKKFLLEKYNLNEGIGSQVMAGLAAAAMGVVSGNASATKPPQNVKQSTQQIQAKPSGTFYDDDIKNLIRQDEGVKSKMYDDGKGIMTVGVGHNLKNEKASVSAFTKAFGKDGAAIRKSVMSGEKMSNDQIEKLFEVDYQEHKNRATSMIPKLQEYSPELQSVLVSGTFRGHVTDSPNFRKLLDSGDYEGAANELLDRGELKEKRDKKGNVIYKPLPGVVTRMNRDAQAVRDYGKKVAEEKAKKEKEQAENQQ
jgi:hypothetical protein